MTDSGKGAKVQAALKSPTIQSRVKDVKEVFSTLSVEELHTHFPHLLSNIFGFNGTDGWCLKMLNRRQHPNDFKLVLEFMEPDGGFLFALINKLQSPCTMRYEYPIDHLPITSQESIQNGIVPHLYEGRVTASSAIALSALEYFLFHFAYFVVYVAQTRRAWSCMEECIYVELFDRYLSFWLPKHGAAMVAGSGDNIRTAITSAATATLLQRNTSSSLSGTTSSYSGLPSSRSSVDLGFSRHLARQASLEGRSVFAPSVSSAIGQNQTPSAYQPLGLLRSPGASPPRVSGGLAAANTHAPGAFRSQYRPVEVDRHGNSPLWQSEMFVEIINEFWLSPQKVASAAVTRPTTGVSPASPGSPASPARNQASQKSWLATEEQVRLVRMFVKHCHRFCNQSGAMVAATSGGVATAAGSAVMASHSSNNERLMNMMTNELRRILIPQFLHQPIYWFLRHHFNHWPLNTAFKNILETWLSFIQPWRYTDDRLPDGDEAKAYDTRTWKPFVSAHILFYTQLFLDLMPRLMRLDLMNIPNLNLLARVAKVYAFENLIDDIAEAEAAYVTQLPAISPLSSVMTSIQPAWSSSPTSSSSPHHRHDDGFSMDTPTTASYSALCQSKSRQQIGQILELLRTAHTASVSGELTQQQQHHHYHAQYQQQESQPRQGLWQRLEAFFMMADSDSNRPGTSPSPLATTHSSDKAAFRRLVKATAQNLASTFKINLHGFDMEAEGVGCTTPTSSASALSPSQSSDRFTINATGSSSSSLETHGGSGITGGVSGGLQRPVLASTPCVLPAARSTHFAFSAVSRSPGRAAVEAARPRALHPHLTAAQLLYGAPLDPDLELVKSYESVFVVNNMRSLSSLLNRTYIPALQRLADRNDVVGSVTRRLFCTPPAPSTATVLSRQHAGPVPTVSPPPACGEQAETVDEDGERVAVPSTPKLPVRPPALLSEAGSGLSPITPPPPGVLRRRHNQQQQQLQAGRSSLPSGASRHAAEGDTAGASRHVAAPVSLRWLASHRVLLLLSLLLALAYLLTPTHTCFIAVLLLACCMLLLISHTSPRRPPITMG